MAQQGLIDRTEAKLRYARLHYEELRKLPRWGSGDDFERGHEEDVLFHVIGAKDAFLHEIADAHGFGLEHVDEDRLEKDFKRAKKRSEAFLTIQKLRADPQSWLSHTITFRNHGTHVASITRIFYIGGEEDGQVRYRDPRTGAVVHDNIPQFLDNSIRAMGLLIADLRKSLPK
jgi:hypothetical protein